TREVKTLPGLTSLTHATYTIRSTIYPALQSATEEALQNGLAQYEMSSGRVEYQGPEANLSDAIRDIVAARAAAPADATASKEPDWQQALKAARLPLRDVHWTPAVVIDKPGARAKSEGLRVGLADGRVMPLHAAGTIQRQLQINDVVLVRVIGGKGKNGSRAEMRVRPVVQGAALVLENKTGRILAMAGGFSYGLSQL